MRLSSAHPITVGQALRAARGRLQRAGSDSAFLDAAVLLGATLGEPTERLLATLETGLPSRLSRRFERLVVRRASGWPVAYLCRRREFYGRSFSVDRRVLIPRPDSESLVETALALAHRDRHIRHVHDCCTGCGSIAITLAGELPHLEMSASDISRRALRVARGNAHALLKGRRAIRFVRLDLLQGMRHQFDMIVSNPPYLSSDEARRLTAAPGGEPAVALDGGADGLDCIRRLTRAAQVALRRSGWLLTEASDDQAEAVRGILIEAGFSAIRQVRDLGQRRRVSVAQKQC